MVLQSVHYCSALDFPCPKRRRILPVSASRFHRKAQQTLPCSTKRCLYVPGGESASPFVPPGKFSAIWDGFLQSDIRTDYTFHADAAGQVRCSINDTLVLEGCATRVHWHHFEPKFWPGYSPDFNPIERLWLRLKADWFGDFIARTPEELTDRLCAALKSFMDQPAKTASICSIRK